MRLWIDGEKYLYAFIPTAMVVTHVGDGRDSESTHLSQYQKQLLDMRQEDWDQRLERDQHYPDWRLPHQQYPGQHHPGQHYPVQHHPGQQYPNRRQPDQHHSDQQYPDRGQDEHHPDQHHLDQQYPDRRQPDQQYPVNPQGLLLW